MRTSIPTEMRYTLGTTNVSYLVVGKLVPGLLAVCEYFPEDHTQTPHITLCGESPVHDALWGHPADGQHGVTTHLR